MEVTVDLQHAFGSQAHTGTRGAALFGDDGGHTLLWSVGRHVASRHLESNEVSVLGLSATDDDTSAGPLGLGVEAITACGVSGNRHLLAVGDKRSAGEQLYAGISIVDLQRPASSPPLARLQAFRNAGSKANIVDVCFSPDADFLAVISTGFEVALTLIDWREDRVMAKLKLESAADRVLLNLQQEVFRVSVSGAHLLKVASIKDAMSKTRETTLKPIGAFFGLDCSATKIHDHCWVEPADGTFMACTQDGSVYWLTCESTSILATFRTVFGPADGGLGAWSIKCFSQGFIVGGSEGVVAVWEKTDFQGEDPEDAYRFGRASCVSRNPSGAAVVGLDLSSMEEGVIICFKSGDIGTLSLPSLMPNAGVGDVFCNLLSGGFHGGAIRGLDIAVHRSLFVSLGKRDGIVRVWNYVSKRCEIRWEPKDKADMPMAVALHPFGFFVALAFAEKLRIFYILAKGLRPVTEFSVRAVKLLKFSDGGHLLAAAQGRFVHLFNAATFRKSVTLQGHNHSIVAMCFNPEDTCMWTCDSTGHLCQWDPLSGDELSHLNGDKSEMWTMASGHVSQACCSISRGKQHYLRRMQHCVQEYEQEVPVKGKFQALSQFPGHSALFAGSSTGSLTLFPSVSVLTKFRELGLHTGPCTSICISSEGRTLVTAGEDGAIFLLTVQGLASEDPAAGSAAAAVAAGDNTAFLAGEVVLVQKSQLQKRIEQCQALRLENNTLQTQLTDETAKLEEECRAKVQEARERDQAEIQELTRRRDGIERATDAKAAESERIMLAMSTAHTTAAEQLTNLYKRKVQHEQDLYSSLSNERTRLLERISEAKQEAEAELGAEREKAQQELERQLAEQNLEIQKHKDLIAFMQHRFQGILAEEEKEHEVDLAALQMSNQLQLKKQKEVEDQLRIEQETLLKGLEIMEEERVRIEREQQEQANRIKHLQEEAEELQRTLSSLELERRERESTLGEKEQKIESYKSKVNTLKTFKVVLDRQLQEVTESLKPKEELIKQLSGHLTSMEDEFQRQLLEQRDMESSLTQKKRQCQLLREQAGKLKEVIAEKDRTIIRYTYDLDSLVKDQPDLKVWPAEIRRMYHTYVCEGQAGEGRLPLETMQKKMNQVERRIASLKVSETQLRAKCKVDIQRKAHENAQLVSDVNELRKDKQNLKLAIRGLRARLEELESYKPQAPSASSSAKALSEVVAPPSPLAALKQRATAGSPGPRQQLGAAGASTTPPPVGPRGGPVIRRSGSRTKSMPPIAPRKVPALPQAPSSATAVQPKASQEDLVKMQVVLEQAELSRETAQVQRRESEVLRERIAQLTKQQKEREKLQKEAQKEMARVTKELCQELGQEDEEEEDGGMKVEGQNEYPRSDAELLPQGVASITGNSGSAASQGASTGAPAEGSGFLKDPRATAAGAASGLLEEGNNESQNPSFGAGTASFGDAGVPSEGLGPLPPRSPSAEGLDLT